MIDNPSELPLPRIALPRIPDFFDSFCAFFVARDGCCAANMKPRRNWHRYKTVTSP